MVGILFQPGWILLFALLFPIVVERIIAPCCQSAARGLIWGAIIRTGTDHQHCVLIVYVFAVVAMIPSC